MAACQTRRRGRRTNDNWVALSNVSIRPMIMSTAEPGVEIRDNGVLQRESIVNQRYISLALAIPVLPVLITGLI